MPVLLAGCTYGQVTWGGDPVENVEISISTCDEESFYAVTDENGFYELNGYEDPSDAVPEGLVLIMVTLPDDTRRFETRSIVYGPCPDDPSKDCDREDIDLWWKPQTAWEWEVWRDGNESYSLNQIYCFFEGCGIYLGPCDPT